MFEVFCYLRRSIATSQNEVFELFLLRMLYLVVLLRFLGHLWFAAVELKSLIEGHWTLCKTACSSCPSGHTSLRHWKMACRSTGTICTQGRREAIDEHVLCIILNSTWEGRATLPGFVAFCCVLAQMLRRVLAWYWCHRARRNTGVDVLDSTGKSWKIKALSCVYFLFG